MLCQHDPVSPQDWPLRAQHASVSPRPHTLLPSHVVGVNAIAPFLCTREALQRMSRATAPEAARS
jgi:hypothetical protein